MWYSHRTPRILQLFYPSLIWYRSKKEKAIYLTFDDGPIPEVTPLVLGILDDYQIKATFFCVGDNVEKHSTILDSIIASGHQIGNHTQHHLNGWKTDLDDYLENIKLCDQHLNLITNSQSFPLFRPPYGKITSSQISSVKKTHKIIMWDVLSGDFDQSLSREKCLFHTINATRNGSIIIFHDNIKAKNKLEFVLPRYIEYCQQHGFEFKTL